MKWIIQDHSLIPYVKRSSNYSPTSSPPGKSIFHCSTGHSIAHSRLHTVVFSGPGFLARTGTKNLGEPWGFRPISPLVNIQKAMGNGPLQVNLGAWKYSPLVNIPKAMENWKADHFDSGLTQQNGPVISHGELE